MRNNKHQRILVTLMLGFILWVATGCGIPATQSVPPQPSSTLTIELPRDTELPTALFLTTPSPMPTLTSSLASPPTLTSTTTATASPIPTLTDQEKTSLLADLLQPTEDCLLPCWWGIEPGKTTIAEIEALVKSFGASMTSDQRDTGLVTYTLRFFRAEEMSTTIEFYDPYNREIVEWVRVAATSRFSNETLLQVWAPYAPERIMQAYGPPSRVVVDTASRANEDPQPEYLLYLISFYYDGLNFSISYHGLVRNDPIYHMCPYFDGGNLGTAIYMLMKSPTSPYSLDQLSRISAGGTRDPQDPGPFALEDITEFSINDLYEKYVAGEEVCFDTPKSIWP